MENLFKLSPNRVWRTYPGGKKLDILEEKDNPDVSHFPEDWIASVTRAVNIGREEFVNEGLSLIDSKGKQVFLADALNENPRAFLGEGHMGKYGAEISYLIKFLDSSIRLHFQCHPDKEFARERLNSPYGKTEGYYILETGPESYIYLGFQNPPTKRELREAVLNQDVDFLESCFEKIPIKPGDAFIVPGGIPHAIGPDVLMIEIMEPSDLAVRFEFERAGYVLPEEARFLGKDLDFALEVFDYNRVSMEQVQQEYFVTPILLSSSDSASVYSIFDRRNTDCFRMERMQVSSTTSLFRDGFFILIAIGGSGNISCDGLDFTYRRGDRFFVTNSAGELYINSEESSDFILALPV